MSLQDRPKGHKTVSAAQYKAIPPSSESQRLQWTKEQTYLAVVDTSHSSVVTRAKGLGAVGALEATGLVEDL